MTTMLLDEIYLYVFFVFCLNQLNSLNITWMHVSATKPQYIDHDVPCNNHNEST